MDGARSIQSTGVSDVSMNIDDRVGSARNFCFGSVEHAAWLKLLERQDGWSIGRRGNRTQIGSGQRAAHAEKEISSVHDFAYDDNKLLCDAIVPGGNFGLYFRRCRKATSAICLQG